MRRSVIAATLVILLCSPLPSRGQAVVIDPSQIAASAVNAADQLDYMFDQLGELAHLGDQLSTVRGYIDEVFGDDGVGGKTISILNDLGTLDRLTQSYMSTIRSTEQLAQTMREMEQFRLSDANMMLTYLRQMKSQAEMAIETAKSIINTLGFSRKEKKDEVDRIIDEMEKELDKMQDMVEIEAEATQIATSLTDFSDYLDETLEGDDYVQTLEVYGSLDEAGEGGLGIISLILGLLTIVSAVWGYIIYSRGSIPGDPVADNVMFRVAAGFAAGLVALEFISYVMGFNL
ncbi:MAG: hypothetical protein IJ307_10665 [Bacteroidales bacterium]|nr:hypothetical protein [Bacteroidales bacterium]